MKNIFYYSAGITIGILSKIKKTLLNKRNPDPRKTDTDMSNSIKYDLDTIDDFKNTIKNISGKNYSFKNKKILEIGPGHDLGTGLILISEGAKLYAATDRFPSLSFNTNFYNALLKKLENKKEIKEIIKEIDKSKKNKTEVNLDNFKYFYHTSEEMAEKINEKFDIIISKNVLEHIINPTQSFNQMYKLLNKDGIIIHLIDFKTHTSYIGNKDKLNMLRYNNFIYNNIVKFKGGPNRYRLSDFIKALKLNKFKDIEIITEEKLNTKEYNSIKNNLNKSFKKYNKEDIETLSAYIFARK